MYKISLAGLSDVDAISSIHVDCWAECYPYIPQSVHESRSFRYRQQQWQNLIRSDDGAEPVLVLRYGAEIVGFANIKINVDVDIPMADYELHACYFRKPHRGTVAGPKMLMAMLAELKRLKSRSFSVWVFASNPLRITYIGLGFEKVVVRDRNLLGKKIPEIGMVCSDYDKLNNTAQNIISRLKCGLNGEAGNRQRSQDRYSRIYQRIDKSL